MANGGAIRNFPAGWASVSLQSYKEGRPSGAGHPIAWVMGQKPGGMSSRNEADFSMNAAFNADLGMGVSLAGAADFSMVAANATLSLITSLSGVTTIVFTQTGGLTAAVGLDGVATITMTQTGLATVLAGLSGSADITFSQTADLRGKSWLHGDITPFTTLSPENLASAVWAYILEYGFSAGELMRIFAAVNAGKTTIGTGPTVVTFKGLDGSKNRVVAGMTSSERTTVTIDATP